MAILSSLVKLASDMQEQTQGLLDQRPIDIDLQEVRPRDSSFPGR